MYSQVWELDYKLSEVSLFISMCKYANIISALSVLHEMHSSVSGASVHSYHESNATLAGQQTGVGVCIYIVAFTCHIKCVHVHVHAHALMMYKMYTMYLHIPSPMHMSICVAGFSGRYGAGNLPTGGITERERRPAF